MIRKKKQHHHEHIDESEKWKRQTLTSAKNRKKFAEIMSVVLWVAAAVVIGACVFAYFIDR